MATAADIPPPTRVVTVAGNTAYELQTAHIGGARPAALLVVLDGNDYFDAATEAAREAAASGTLPPSLIVGISANSGRLTASDARLRDYTDQVSDDLKPDRIRRQGIETGGVDKFVTALRGQLLPSIGGRQAIDQRCTAVFGHSLAGLGVLHILATSPNSFGTYIASSPSIWWGGRSVLARLDKLKRKPTAGRPRLLITVGALEESEGTSPRPGTPNFQMIANAQAANRIVKAQPNAVDASFELFAGQDHQTAARAALRRGLALLGRCRPGSNARLHQHHLAGEQGGVHD